MSPGRKALLGAIGYNFRDDKLLQAALTHRSAERTNNERLEFLGDAVLNCVIAALLYRQLPAAPEGDLSRLRASLVKQSALAQIAGDLQLGDQLMLGGGELKTGGFRRKSILADAVEALIGAVYLDGGFACAEQVIGCLYAGRLANLPPAETLKDSKTRLQEYLQGRGMMLPVYHVERVEGAAHRQNFLVSCRVEALAISEEGGGSTRRRAEQIAAEKVLARLTSPVPGTSSAGQAAKDQR